MAPVADPSGEMRARRTTSGRRIVSKPRRRNVGANDRDAAFVSRARASGRDRPNSIPLREGLARHQRDDDVNFGDPRNDNGRGADADENGRGGRRNREQQGPDGENRDGRNGDGGDGPEDGRDNNDNNDGFRPGNPLAILPPAITSNPLTVLSPLLPTPILTSELPPLRTSSPLESSTPILSTPVLSKPVPVETPSPTSTTSTMSTLTAVTGLPTEAGDNTIVANNPQVVTMSAVTATTTTSVVAIPIVTPEIFASALFPPTLASDLAPSPTVFIDNTGNDDQNRHGRNGGPPGGLSPTGEDALISAGSIGRLDSHCGYTISRC